MLIYYRFKLLTYAITVGYQIYVVDYCYIYCEAWFETVLYQRAGYLQATNQITEGLQTKYGELTIIKDIM